MTNDWSLSRGRFIYSDYGVLYIKYDNVKKLRKKLIEDVKRNGQISHPYGSNSIIEMINKRFGVEEDQQ